MKRVSNEATKVEVARNQDWGRQGGDSLVGGAIQGAVEATEVVAGSVEKAKETVDTAWDAAKKTAELVAEADTNVVDTVEYRSSEDLMGHLGDGCDTNK
ncbi:hypothetical protein RJT34_29217 [Clitoria ternatea]|uniref:Uncharacterized protein n=1 Tax=Clitoria ternatea TaxID=43366 RepID=A0AAN9FIK6_CLITE